MVSGGDLTKQTLTDDQRKELAKRSLKQETKSLKTQEAKWAQEPTAFDNLPAHEKPFPIEPFPHERQRLPFKMSDEDRLRRAKWVHSQELTDREPVRVPDLERMIYNPFRRLYLLPTNRLFNSLAPIIGEHRVPIVRYLIPKFFLGYIGGCIIWYNLKYNQANWEKRGGFTIIKTRDIYLPEEEKPKVPKKWDYADNGFQARKVFKGDEYAY